MAISGNGKVGQRLLDLKSKLEEKKIERSEVQGEFNAALKQLKQELSVETIEEAEAQLEEHRNRLESIENDIKKKLQEAEEAFEQIEE